MTRDYVPDAVRLYALEILICQGYAAFFAARPDPTASLASLRASILAGAAHHPLPASDPALSDHVSAEYEAALNRLLDMIEAMARTVRPHG